MPSLISHKYLHLAPKKTPRRSLELDLSKAQLSARSLYSTLGNLGEPVLSKISCKSNSSFAPKSIGTVPVPKKTAKRNNSSKLKRNRDGHHNHQQYNQDNKNHHYNVDDGDGDGDGDGDDIDDNAGRFSLINPKIYKQFEKMLQEHKSEKSATKISDKAREKRSNNLRKTENLRPSRRTAKKQHKKRDEMVAKKLTIVNNPPISLICKRRKTKSCKLPSTPESSVKGLEPSSIEGKENNLQKYNIFGGISDDSKARQSPKVFPKRAKLPQTCLKPAIDRCENTEIHQDNSRSDDQGILIALDGTATTVADKECSIKDDTLIEFPKNHADKTSCVPNLEEIPLDDRTNVQTPANDSRVAKVSLNVEDLVDNSELEVPPEDYMIDSDTDVDEELVKLTDSLENIHLPQIVTTLKPHQVEFHEFAFKLETLRKHGGCLFDEMGLGKTLSMVSLFVERCRRRLISDVEIVKAGDLRMLVVCPKNAVGEWIQQINMHTLGVNVRKFGPSHRSKTTKPPEELIPEIFVITYDELLSDCKSNFGNTIIGKPKKSTKQHKTDNSLSSVKYHEWAPKLPPLQTQYRGYPSLFDEVSQQDPHHLDEIMPHVFEKTVQPLCDIAPRPEAEFSQLSVYSNYWGMIVADEAHLFRNLDSQRWKAMRALVKTSPFRWVVTGTPINNKIEDAVSLLSFIGCKLPSVEKRGYDELMGNNRSSGSHKRKPQFSDVMLFEEIKKELDTVAMRRKMKDLPDSYKFDLSSPFMTLEEFKLYYSTIDKLENMVRDHEITTETSKKQTLKQSALETLLRLRQVCTHPKTVYSLEHPEYAPENDDKPWLGGKCTKMILFEKYFKQKVTEKDKVIVFSNFLDVLDQCGKKLDELRIKYVRLDGSSTVEEREISKSAYINDPAIRVFLISTKAGNTALNLQNTTRILLFDMSLNPQTDIQGFGRALRIGQTSNVIITKLKILGTVETRIQKRCDSKSLLADCLLDKDKSLSHALESFRTVKKSLLAEDRDKNKDGDMANIKNTIQEYKTMLAGQIDGWHTKSKFCSQTSAIVGEQTHDTREKISPIEMAYREYVSAHKTYFQGKETMEFDEESMYFYGKKELETVSSVLTKRKRGVYDRDYEADRETLPSKKSKYEIGKFPILGTTEWVESIEQIFSLNIPGTSKQIVPTDCDSDSFVVGQSADSVMNFGDNCISKSSLPIEYHKLKSVIQTNSYIPDGTILYTCTVDDPCANMLKSDHISLRQRFMFASTRMKEYYVSPLEAIASALNCFKNTSKEQMASYNTSLTALENELIAAQRSIDNMSKLYGNLNDSSSFWTDYIAQVKTVEEKKIALQKERNLFIQNSASSVLTLSMYRAKRLIKLTKRVSQTSSKEQQLVLLNVLYDVSGIASECDSRTVTLGGVQYWVKNLIYSNMLSNFTIQDISRSKVLDLWNLSSIYENYTGSDPSTNAVLLCLIYEIGCVQERRRCMNSSGERFYHLNFDRYNPEDKEKSGDYYHVWVDFNSNTNVSDQGNFTGTFRSITDGKNPTRKATAKIYSIHCGSSSKPLDLKYFLSKLTSKVGCDFERLSFYLPHHIRICNSDCISFERSAPK